MAEGFEVLAAQGAAHHTGASHTEKIVYSVESQENRSGQRHRRRLNGVVEHPHKIRVRQTVQD